MFPEYRELISKLKNHDQHFDRLFHRHNELDQKIINMETRVESGTDVEVELLKKEKLNLKDEIYAILRKASQAE